MRYNSVTGAFHAGTLWRYSLPVTSNTLLSEGFFSSFSAIMSEKTRQFYVLRVEDFKPVIWDQATETLDADDLVYVIDTEVQNVAITDVRVGVTPELSEAA